MDNDISAKPRPVLAHTPAFSFELSLTTRGLQCPRRQASVSIFRRIEAWKMLSNNFTGGIALESFRAWVPACNDTRAIEHKNSVVRHCLNEEAVPSFNRQRCQISIGLFH